MKTTNKPMTGEQLDELMTVAVNMQRDSEKAGERPAAMFAYAVQVAVLELRKVRDDAAALAVQNAELKSWAQVRATSDDALEQDNYMNLKIDWRQRSLAEIKTPATDSYLAEVRAQGVDAGIEHLHKIFDGTDHIGEPLMALEWLAQVIRKGAAQ